MFKFFEFNGVASCHSDAIDEAAIYVESIGYKKADLSQLMGMVRHGLDYRRFSETGGLQGSRLTLRRSTSLTLSIPRLEFATVSGREPADVGLGGKLPSPIRNSRGDSNANHGLKLIFVTDVYFRQEPILLQIKVNNCD
jgi:hypothetical protein